MEQRIDGERNITELVPVPLLEYVVTDLFMDRRIWNFLIDPMQLAKLPPASPLGGGGRGRELRPFPPPPHSQYVCMRQRAEKS